LDVNDGAEYLDMIVIGVGREFTVWFTRGVPVGVIAELGKPKPGSRLAEAINILIVGDGAEVCGLGCCGATNSVDDIS
jgi:hypothetical protein